MPQGVRWREGDGNGASGMFEARDVLSEGAPNQLAAENLEAADLRRLIAGEPGGNFCLQNDICFKNLTYRLTYNNFIVRVANAVAIFVTT